jgi:Dolichyl-phosphate-mannose-protein mannosyltransferase
MRYLQVKYIKNIIFAICFIASAGFIGFHKTINLAPQSLHYWRQADCTSQTLNYFKDGMDFFSPRIHNYGWTDDSHTAGEFPILYYFTAFLYHFLGQHEWILRGLNLLIYFFGLWALYRLAWHFTGQLLISICFSLLFLASPLLAFYGCNYLPNVPALSMVFLSWLFFYYYVDSKQIKWFYACNTALLFAGLIKPTMLVTWVAIGAVWLFEILRGGIAKKKSTVFNQIWAVIPAFLLVLIPFLTWRLWAENYNKIHDTGYYFLNTIMPIWDMKPNDVSYTFSHIQNDLFKTWFTLPTLCLTVAVILANLILIKKQNQLFFAIFCLILIGTTMYFFAFFRQFMVHDYYSSDLFTIPAISLLLFFYCLKSHFKSVLNNRLLQFAFIILTIMNLFNAQHEFEARYDKAGLNDFHLARYNIHEIRQFINKNTPISAQDTIISLPDISPNTSLYYYDRRGYTYWNFGPTIIWSKDWMKLMIKNHHCKYLIINDISSNQLDSIRPFLKQPLAELDSTILVYDLAKVVSDVQ